MTKLVAALTQKGKAMIWEFKIHPQWHLLERADDSDSHLPFTLLTLPHRSHSTTKHTKAPLGESTLKKQQQRISSPTSAFSYIFLWTSAHCNSDCKRIPDLYKPRFCREGCSLSRDYPKSCTSCRQAANPAGIHRLPAASQRSAAAD